MNIGPRAARLLTAAALLLLVPGICLAAGGAGSPKAVAGASTGGCGGAPTAHSSVAQVCIPAGAVLRVRIAGPLKMSKLTAGQVIAGATTEPLYDVDRIAILSGTPVRLSIKRVERVKGKRRRFSDVVTLLFRPPYQWQRQYRLFFRSAGLQLPDGSLLPASFSFVRAEHPEQVQPRGKALR